MAKYLAIHQSLQPELAAVWEHIEAASLQKAMDELEDRFIMDDGDIITVYTYTNQVTATVKKQTVVSYE